MKDLDETARSGILARLAQSRQEVRQLLDPPRNDGDSTGAGHAGGFPRSRTMRMLMSTRGLGALSAIAGGLLVARPALVLRMLKLLPTGAVARMIAVNVLSALRTKRS